MPGRVETAGPVTPGAHNEEIYCGRLGLSREDLAGLGEKGNPSHALRSG